MKRLFLFLGCIFSTLGVKAERSYDGAFEYGFHMGRVLPDQIDGVTEILSSWGVHGTYLRESSNIELDYSSGQGDGAQMSNLSLSLRADIPVEDLIGMIYFGGSVVHYSGSSTPETTTGSGHVGCGMMMPLARGIYFRTDMKFNFNPGVAMVINFGMTFDWDSGK